MFVVVLAYALAEAHLDRGRELTETSVCELRQT